MRKYIEALELELEFTCGNSEILNDISESKSLLFRLVLTKDHEKRKVALKNTFQFSTLIFKKIFIVN